jgi:hypothetical protein
MIKPSEIWDWMQANADALRLWSGVVLALFVLVLLYRAYRGGGVGQAATVIAIPTVIGWEAEGMFELFHREIGAPWLPSVVGSAMTSAVLVAIGARAHEHWEKYKVLGPNGRTVWYIAVPVGLIVAAAADSLSISGLRILIPVLGVALLFSRYRKDEPPEEDGAKRKRKTGSWRWTPRALAIWAGAIRPDEDDVDNPHREHQIRRMVSLKRKVKVGSRLLRGRRQLAYERLTETADQEMMDEVYSRLANVELDSELAEARLAQKRAELRAELAGRLAGLDPTRDTVAAAAGTGNDDSVPAAAVVPVPADEPVPVVAAEPVPVAVQPVPVAPEPVPVRSEPVPVTTFTATAQHPLGGPQEAPERTVTGTVYSPTGTAYATTGTDYRTGPGTGASGPGTGHPGASFDRFLNGSTGGDGARIQPSIITQREPAAPTYTAAQGGPGTDSTGPGTDSTGPGAGQPTEVDSLEDDTTEPTLTKKETARRYWDREMAAGRVPSGADLERVSGASDGLGRRWVRLWSAEAGIAQPVSGAPLNGAHVA